MKSLRAISIVGAQALAGAVFGASVDVQFLGGTAHDPDGAGFGLGSAQTGFFRLTVESGGNSALALGDSFLTFRLDVTPAIHEGLHGFALSSMVAPSDDLGLAPAALSSQVAYLYTQFRAGTLAGFDAGVDTDLDALQDAIWHFQGLLGASEDRRADPAAILDDEGAYTLSDRAMDFVAAADAAVQNGSWTGIGNIRVLTTTAMGDDDGPSQGNYLAFVPVVPLPGPAGLAIGGLLVVGARRRRSL